MRGGGGAGRFKTACNDTFNASVSFFRLTVCVNEKTRAAAKMTARPEKKSVVFMSERREFPERVFRVLNR